MADQLGTLGEATAGLVHTSSCVVFLGHTERSFLSFSEPCLSCVRWEKHSCITGVASRGLRCTVGVSGCPPLLLSPAYYEIGGSQKDTEVAAVDRSRSRAPRSLERKQPHNSLVLDSRLLQSQAHRQSWGLVSLQRSWAGSTWCFPIVAHALEARQRGTE